jgi:hypothetical protein
MNLVLRQLATLTLSLSLKDSEHLHEIKRLSEKLSHTVEVTRYNQLNAKLIEAEKRAQQLATALEERTTHTNKLIEGI